MNEREPIVAEKTKEQRAIKTLKEALSGYSPVSKSTLIKEAIKILEN